MYKTVNGIRINYEEKGEGELIVLLHGWGSNIRLFANLIALLSRKYKVVAMDMPGFGEGRQRLCAVRCRFSERLQRQEDNVSRSQFRRTRHYQAKQPRRPAL